MINCRWKLIIYPAGARGDFVCGWAGLLPNVINNYWVIDPVTGMSHGNFETKFLDYGSSVDQVLTKHNMQLDAQSSLFFVGPCHGYQLDLKSLQDHIKSGAVQLYVIDITQADPSTILWECIVKTYLSQRNTVYLQDTNQSWLIDSQIDSAGTHITDQQRIEAVKHKIRTVAVNEVNQFFDLPYTTKLDYSKLFVPGGSHYLCQRLQLSAPETCHKFWNQMLDFAQSPNSLEVWDHVWRKKDFFN